MCEDHTYTLSVHLVELQQSIDKELAHHVEHLRERLLCHVAEAILKFCSGPHDDTRELTKLRQYAQRHGHGSDTRDGGWVYLCNPTNDTNLLDVPTVNSDDEHYATVSERDEDSSLEGSSKLSRSGADAPHDRPDKNTVSLVGASRLSRSEADAKYEMPFTKLVSSFSLVGASSLSRLQADMPAQNTAIRRASSSESARRKMIKAKTFVSKMFRTSDRYSAGFEKGMLPAHGCIGCLSRFVCSRFFDGFFNFLIVFNCVTMGLESQQAVNGYISGFGKPFIIVSEHALTSLFTLELCLKLRVFGVKIFIPWNRGHMNEDGMVNFMDAILVLFTGVIFLWIIPVISAIAGFSDQNSLVRTLSVLRVMRLLRLVRVIRGHPSFREAWLLLRGLSDSMRTLFWTCIVLGFITYIFAVFGMSLISKELVDKRNAADSAARKAHLSELLEFVGGLDLLMFTLFQVLTLDSWDGIVRPMKKELPWCWMYFYAYIAIAVFVLMNLVTAIIVDNAVAHRRQDEADNLKRRETTKTEELQKLERLFTMIDADGSGTINWQEFSDAFEDPEIADTWRLLDFDPEECLDLFLLLDDGDGEIKTVEFFYGLKKMKGMAQSKDIFKVQKDLNTLVEILKHHSEASRQEGSQDDGQHGNVDRDVAGLADGKRHRNMVIDKNDNGLAVMVKDRLNRATTRRTVTDARLLGRERFDNSVNMPTLDSAGLLDADAAPSACLPCVKAQGELPYVPPACPSTPGRFSLGIQVYSGHRAI